MRKSICISFFCFLKLIVILLIAVSLTACGGMSFRYSGKSYPSKAEKPLFLKGSILGRCPDYKLMSIERLDLGEYDLIGRIQVNAKTKERSGDWFLTAEREITKRSAGKGADAIAFTGCQDRAGQSWSIETRNISTGISTYSHGKKKNTYMLQADLYRCRENSWCCSLSSRAQFLAGTYIRKDKQHKLKIGLAPNKKNLVVFGMSKAMDTHNNLKVSSPMFEKPYTVYSVEGYRAALTFKLSNNGTQVVGLNMAKAQGKGNRARWKIQNYNKQ